MKVVNLEVLQTFSISIDNLEQHFGKAEDIGNGLVSIPLGNIVDSVSLQAMNVARENAGKVIHAATFIESQLVAILLDYFMGPFAGHDDRRVTFEQEILQSSFLSYSAKKELFGKIVLSAGLLEGGKKNVAQSHLKKVMEWRNAFAHGKLQHDNPKGCFVQYHSGEQKRLTDDYWSDVERVFSECSSLLKEARIRLAEVVKHAPKK
jgi:hypothetical protein